MLPTPELQSKKDPRKKSLKQFRHLSIVEISSKLASAYRRSEDISVVPIVIPELKLGNIQRQILGTDFMEAADYAAFEDAPEAFNRVGVNSAHNVAMRGMMDGLVGIVGQSTIDAAFVRREQADFIGNSFAYETFRVLFGDGPQHAGDNIAFAAHSADDRDLSGRRMFAANAALIGMFVLVLAADVGFIDLNDTAQLVHVALDKRRADFVAHEPSGFDRTEAHVAPDLARTHALFTGEHEVSDFEPVAERLVGVLKNRACDNREPIAVLCTFLALPMPLAGREVIDGGIAAARTGDALRPAAGLQIGLAGVLVIDGEHPVKLGGSQLVNGLRHGSSPSQWKDIAL
jgi:hypothetical protein